MSWSTGVRKVHRWTSVVFVVVVGYLTVAVNTRPEEPAEWVYLMPLLPLAILAVTGLYMLVQPYAASVRRRRARGQPPMSGAERGVPE